MARRIESHILAGPAGQLEALLEEPEDRDPLAAALVCHPHPLYGGTMHNKVVYRLARGLRRAGSVVLRFNFRGVNRSEGVHDDGIGEVEDARAALTWLRSRYPALPYSLAGFSFGSRVILRLGCTLPDVKRLFAVGFPTRSVDPACFEACRAPRTFIQSVNDEHGPRPALEAIFERLEPPKELVWIEARDHFFDEGLDQLEEEVVRIAATA